MNNLSTSIATTREQSERLLAMGVNPETADMYRAFDGNPYFITYTLKVKEDCCKIKEDDVTAWSLSRLISMMPTFVATQNDESQLYILFHECRVSVYYKGDIDRPAFFSGSDIFSSCIDMIECLINNNCFDKKYLK